MKRVLVIGDFARDVYTDVRTVRSSPEASDAPVLDVVSRQEYLGCAGNVVANLFALMGQSDNLDAVGGMGEWEANKLGGITDELGRYNSWAEEGSQGITKERLLLDGRIIARVDSSRFYRDLDTAAIRDDMEFAGEHWDLIVVSD